MSSQKTKLTKTFVDSLPISPDKQVFYRDSELLGFALRVTSSKVYIVERRLGSGTSSVRVTIGKHGDITIAQARQKAQVLLAQMATGVNPNHLKKEKKFKIDEKTELATSQPTLNDAYHAYKSERKLSEKTLRDYNQCMNDYLGDWKETRLIDITCKMVQDKHALLTIRSKARANLAMRFLRALFNFSTEYYLDLEDRNIIDVFNPVNTLNAKKLWNKVRCRNGYICKDQLKNWINTVLSTEWVGQQYYNHNAYTNQDFMLFILLTGFRREEAECVEWKDVDLKYGTITSVDPKSGDPLTLPVGPILLHLLKARFDRSGLKPYVFQAKQGNGHITNRSKARLKVAEISGIEFTFHDLRRTFLSLANSINIGLCTIKSLIDHTTEISSEDVTDGYIQVSFDDLKDAMTKIENVVFDAAAKQTIYQRSFKKVTRHQDYLEDAIALELEKNPSLKALSKIEKLNAVMKPK